MLVQKNKLAEERSFSFSKEDFERAILRSQHCQRNWDLTKRLPEEHIELLQFAVENCPSKQNIAFYKVKFIQNREIIRAIHDQTNGFVIDYESNASVTNSQTLANLLIVFEPHFNEETFEDPKKFSNLETFQLKNKEADEARAHEILMKDQFMAVGIAAGYVNLLSSLLGYRTGCCACFNAEEVQKIINGEDHPLLLMGVGYPDPGRRRREHHSSADFIFPTKQKQKIKVERID